MLAEKGLFIVFEGIDGAGLTTNSKLLTEHLNALNIKAKYTKEPTQSEVGLIIRECLKKGCDPYHLSALFTADRAIHVKKEIIPFLKEGFIVICDRYYYSTIVYQSVHGARESVIRKMNSAFPRPDLVFLLDVDPEISLKRKGKDKEIYEKKDFLEKARLKFLELASEENFVVIPSHREINIVQEDIRRVTKYLLEEVGKL